MGEIGAVVEAVAVAAGEDQFLGGKRGEFLLEGSRAETGETGEIAEVDFLIPAREEQAEDFRPGLGKEIGRDKDAEIDQEGDSGGGSSGGVG
jgi:hypothetical protein